MNANIKIDEHLYHSHSGVMMALAMFLVVDIPLTLIIIGMVFFHLLLLAAINITDRLQSLTTTKGC